MSKIIAGLSGGVDSAVAAYILRAAGHEVIGVTLKTWIGADGKDSRCCEIDDARGVADILGIPYYAVSCMDEFREYVTRPFVSDYIHGLTPNPCIVCNRAIKWTGLMRAAEMMNADFIATGHYASVLKKENGRYTVKKALHAAKDQTYMLFRLTQEQLSRTVMPLGRLDKEEVRRIAAAVHIPVADKPDSQELCFVPDGSYADFVEKEAEEEIPGEGFFVDEAGNVLGKHKGIIHYTVGQRKGLGIALGAPAYIKEIRADKNEIVLSDAGAASSNVVVCDRAEFMGIPPMEPGEKLRCDVKIRYHHREAPALVEMKEGGEVVITFDSPQSAPAPGQSAVFYDEDSCVLGGGRIIRTG